MHSVSESMQGASRLCVGYGDAHALVDPSFCDSETKCTPWARGCSLFLPRYAVFDGIRAVFPSGFLLFRFLKLDQPRLHHDFFDGHEPYAQAIQKLGRHDLGGQLQRRRAAELRAPVRVHVRAHHRQLRRGQLGERRALGNHLAHLDAVLLALPFWPDFIGSQ